MKSTQKIPNRVKVTLVATAFYLLLGTASTLVFVDYESVVELLLLSLKFLQHVGVPLRATDWAVGGSLLPTFQFVLAPNYQTLNVKISPLHFIQLPHFC